MIKETKRYNTRIIAYLMAILIALSPFASIPVQAADGTLTFNSGPTISYGDYFTTHMSFDGDNTAYCLEPMKSTPAPGEYEYDYLPKNSIVRQALYYLPGGYGYDANIKKQHLDDWSTDNAYVIGHLVVAYLYAGKDANSGAFYGAPQNFIDKAIAVTSAIESLPAPPKSFKAFIVIGYGSQTIAGSWYERPNGFLEIRKSSSNDAVSKDNENYSLKGAKYGIYKKEKLVETLVTDEKGYAKSGELEEGNYTLKELESPVGFAIDTREYKVSVTAEETQTVKVPENPTNNPVDLLLQKLDAETGTNLPQGTGTLKDAEFTFKFYEELSDTDPALSGKKPKRTRVLKTDAKGEIHFTKEYLVSGDEFYYDNDGKAASLPIGTVTAQETKAPSGYKINDTVFVQKIVGDGNKETISVYNVIIAEEQLLRGGVKIQKRDWETKKAEAQGGASLEHAEFTITTLNNNPVLVDGKSYAPNQVVMTIKANAAGIASTKKDALPFGHYRIDEIAPPEGYLNTGKISIEFDIVEDGKIVELTAEDNSILNQVIRGDLEFVKVSDGDLNRLANVPFSITSKTTGESHTLVTDKNGYASTSAEWNKHTANTNRGETSEDGIWFGSSAPDDSKGALIYDTYIIEEQKCKVNEGMNLLKFEATVYKDKVTVDLGTLTDDQITIATTAVDGESGSHMAKPEKSITLVDTVEFEGLKKGQEYKLTGTLMDKETGKPIQIDGKPVTAETTFQAKKSTGSVKVKFTFDATSLKGKTVVVFEELYQEDLKLAVHADITDEDQTVYFPEVSTSAKDADTDSNLSCADEEVTLIDTMTYKNLIPGETFHVTGTLMDKETGKPVEADGKPITSTLEFTPKEPSGSVDIPFSFIGSKLQGKTVVVFESVTYKDKEVAAHADFEDIGQTIFFPELATTASDKETGSQHAVADKEVTLVDVVEYKNLIADGRTYHLSGILMDKETKKILEVNGKQVTAEAEFIPEEPSGSIELTFTFDGSELKGKTIVAFETLTVNEKEVAVHADITDKSQTIYFPEIRTSAKDKEDGDQKVPTDTKVTIVDTVSYKNLISDGKHTYRIKGILMDKKTGKALLIDNKQVTSETEFITKKPDGNVELSFTFDSRTLSGHEVVVFEQLLYVHGKTEVLIATHEDINDKGQTVKVTELPKETPPETPSENTTKSSPVKTGDETPYIFYLILAFASLTLISAGGYLFYKKRKNKS